MAGNIFINYRRDESGHVAGRLHDSLAPTFGRNKLFMDVDNIPVGRDFEEYLKSQVAACDAMLAVIGPNWLAAKDETGKRRLDNPDDFIVIEIGAALARNIPVVPVLVDGARMPKASELPESLKPLVRRQAVEVRHANFSRDAEALVKRLRGALGYDSFGRRRRSMAAALAAMVMLLLAGWAGYKFMPFTKSDIGFTSIQSTTTSNKDGLIIEETHVTTRRADEEEKRTAAEVKRKVDEALGSGAMGDPKHITTLTLRTPTDAGQERQARPAFEPEAKRKAEEADRQRQVNIQAEQERRAKAEAEVKEKRNQELASRYSDFISQGETAYKAGDYNGAVANYNEALRLNSEGSDAFFGRGAAYLRRREFDLAIADFTEVIKLNPNNFAAITNRGVCYLNKGDLDHAIGDFNAAIRLNPNDFRAYYNLGFIYHQKGNYTQAIADYDEAIRLNPNYATAFCGRGNAKLKDNDTSGKADIAKARQLDGSACR